MNTVDNIIPHESELDQLNTEKDQLINRRNSILRGFGSRYSYRSKLKSSPDENKIKIKNNSKRIKSAKQEIIEINDKINDINFKIQNLTNNESPMQLESSKKFNCLYLETMKEF